MIVRFLGLFLIVAVSVHAKNCPMVDWRSHEVTPWPKPSQFSNGTIIGALDANFEIVTASPSSILERAISRYSGIIKKSSALCPVSTSILPSTTIQKLEVVVNNDDETLGPDTDESYDLSVSSAGEAKVMANGVFGAIRALESFAQLVEVADVAAATLVIRGLPWSIHDAPRFSHRALLIDSSRHFLPVAAIQEYIDAMSYNKLSVLHWHLVDSQTFPFASQAAPKLGLGAWGPRSQYSSDDLRQVVSYAKDRAVRVMVEIDTPGHSNSWGAGYPDIVAACPNTVGRRGDAYGALDPSNEKTFEVVEALLKELADIFPDPFFHIGGDEVIFDCWRESKRVGNFMADMGMKSYEELEAYYFQRLFNITDKVLANRTLVAYQDVMDNGVALPTRVVFDVWTVTSETPLVSQEISRVVDQGHQVILANGNSDDWYLNVGFGFGGSTVSLWPAVYSLDPLNGTDFTPEQQKLVLGGEASMWGELVNENNLMEKSWPRASAFAERMWSGANVNDIWEAAPRLARFYCRMAARNVRVSPASPGSCDHW